jgi:WASH complex subunit 7
MDSKTTSSLDEFFENDTGADAPGQELLHVVTSFALDYEKKLKQFQEALSVDVAPQTWDPEYDTIAIDTTPSDHDHVLMMIQTENQQFNKVAVAFSSLLLEINDLSKVARTRFYGPLTMFGHVVESVDDDDDGDEDQDSKYQSQQQQQNEQKDPAPIESQMGHFMTLLQDLSNFVTRLHALARNLVNQLACLYHERQKLYLSTFKHVQLDVVYETLGTLCHVLITLDSIVADNANIELAWNTYKRMVKYIRSDPAKYGADATQLRSFENMLLSLDRIVIGANMFESMLSQDFSLDGKRNLVAGNAKFYNHMTTQIKGWTKRVANGLGEDIETYARTKLVDLFGLYALYRRMFRTTAEPERSMFKALWQMQKKVPIVMLYARASWLVADFLEQYAPLQTSGLNPSIQNLNKYRHDWLRNDDERFAQRTEELYRQIATWMVRIESELVATKDKNLTAVLNSRSKLLINGVLLANQVRNHVLTSINMHLLQGKPFIAANVRSIALCAEMLKAIEDTYHRRSRMITDNISHMIGQTAYALKRIYFPIKKRLESPQSANKMDLTKLDVLAAVNLGLVMLSGAPTDSRRTVAEFALSVAKMKSMLKSNLQEEARYQLWKLDLLSTWKSTIAETCNCDFLYWVVDLVPAILNDVWEHPDQVNRLQYLLSALGDPLPLLRDVAHQDDHEEFARAYQRDCERFIEDCIINPLCRAVETDLRLHIHSVVLQQVSLRSQSSVKDLSRFINVKPLALFNKVIDLRARVTHYLDSMFYNLTTVSLHDWRVYAEMRNLAYEKYGLNMTEVHLPGHSHYSEALDVLEIMRNVHIFVARYNYNMNTQIFVERAFDQKHLNTINIQHISNSIRTHGTGIMNTTVNFTYQFLCRKFVVFSEFLFDDHIKSRLMKDLRYYRNERDALENKYPYDRAEKFLSHIRKLGVTPDGNTFLDHFRQQITEIGNALGYVRMVRSGGMQYASNSIKFVPDLDDIPSFHEDAKNVLEAGDQLEDGSAPPVDLSLPEETLSAARNLDGVLDDLSKSFAEGTEYFSILVKIFQQVFRSDEQKHLRNFHMIAPPLMINFVDKMIAQKDNLNKKGGRGETSFTDDGFSLGLAYILKLLKQEDEFEGLHWFDAVRDHLRAKLRNVRTILKDKKLRQEDRQHHELVVKRISAVMKEFELLFYSFSGARIFFRDPHMTQAATAAGADADADAVNDTEAPIADSDEKQPPAPAAPAVAAGGSVPAAPNVPVAPSVPVPPPVPASGSIPAPPPVGVIPVPPPLPPDVGGTN